MQTGVTYIKNPKENVFNECYSQNTLNSVKNISPGKRKRSGKLAVVFVLGVFVTGRDSRLSLSLSLELSKNPTGRIFSASLEQSYNETLKILCIVVLSLGLGCINRFVF